MKGFHIDLNNYYPGVNALTLSTIAIHLADKFDDKKDPDPDITRIRKELPELRGALIFALEARAEDEIADYWTLISLAELRVLTAENTSSVARAYRKALTASRRNLFLPELFFGTIGDSQSAWLAGEFVQGWHQDDQRRDCANKR